MENYDKKEIIILFGEMGGGKNYWGEIYAYQLNYHFFDGDTVATPQMMERVSKFKPLNKEIISNYLTILTSEIINRASVSSNGLVVAQALYNNKDRISLKEKIEATGEFNVNFFWVHVPFLQNLKQIYSRPKGFRWALYWLINKPFFQKPTHTNFRIQL